MIIIPNHGKKITKLVPEDYCPNTSFYKMLGKAALLGILIGTITLVIIFSI